MKVARKIIWGTMRMLEHSSESHFWEGFFIRLKDNGIGIIHSSIEYESFPMLCEVLRRLKQRNITFKHVVKLAEPSFDDDGFSPERLHYKIETYKRLLGSNSIHTIQWMWRKDLDNDCRRIEEFHRNQSIFIESFATEKNQDNIINVMCFPYSTQFADTILDASVIDGLIVYCNPNEQEYNSSLEKCRILEKQVYTLRPFQTGKISKTTKELLDFSFQPSSVVATILTATKDENILSVFDYIRDYEKTI